MRRPKSNPKKSRAVAAPTRPAVVAPGLAAARRRGRATSPDAATVRTIFTRLREQNPEPKSELVYDSPFTLLVAVMLSAQATDASVNKATRHLFRIADTPAKILALGEDRVREMIMTIGLYRNKAKNLIALSRQLIDNYGGEVPDRR